MSCNEDDDVNQMELSRQEWIDTKLNLTEYDVICRVQAQDPTIKSVYVFFDDFEDEPEQFNWEAAGEIIGSSRHVKYVMLIVPPVDLLRARRVASFFRGLALNRSIEFLSISVGDFDQDLNADSRNLFKTLGPFFKNNHNLRHLEIYYTESNWGMISAIDAGEFPNLEGVCLKRPLGDSVNTLFEDEMVRTIITRHNLKQITFQGHLCGGNSVVDIKSMLADPLCKVKYLTLNDIRPEHATNVATIASGLDKNSSVKHLKCCGDHAYLLLDFKSPNFTLEKLDLIHIANIDRSLAIQLKGLLALKSLNLGSYTGNPQALGPIFRAVLTPASKLEELILYHGLDDDLLQILGDCMVANTSMKSLDLSHYRDESTTIGGWKSFFRQLRSCSFRERVESLILSNNYGIHGESLEELTHLIKNSKTLKILDLSGCDLPARAWRSLLENLYQTTLQKLLGISFREFTDESLANLHRLFDNGHFKVAAFEGMTPSQSRFVQDVVGFLTHKNCRAEELNFGRCAFDGQHDLNQTTSGWFEYLSRNHTLKSLSITYNVWWRNSRFGFWPQYSRLLCNKDSIGATHSSNHTLQSLNFLHVSGLNDDEDSEEQFASEVRNVPLEIYSLLQLNKGTDKSAVARRKVIQVHFSGLSGVQKLHDLDLGLKMMPQLVSWIGKEMTDISIMYNFLHDNPSLFEAGIEQTRKRKVC